LKFKRSKKFFAVYYYSQSEEFKPRLQVGAFVEFLTKNQFTLPHPKRRDRLAHARRSVCAFGIIPLVNETAKRKE